MIATVETAYINKWAGSVLPPAGIKSPFGEMGIPYHSFQVILLFATLAFGKFANDAILFEENQEELKKRQLEAELEGLKAQVNPHFLFNALNTIYGLARRSDKVTADAVMQLSSILRHNLYDSSENEIEIYKEIEMLHEYISFTRLRLFDKNQITLTIKPGIRNQMIAPMVLLPFVENAFKYGFDNYAENCWVHIDIAFEDGNLIFHCSNSSRKKEKHKTNGIGLKNVKRRLELSYPGKHKLSIESKTDEFLVLLKIKLG